MNNTFKISRAINEPMSRIETYWIALILFSYSGLFLLIFQPFGEVLHQGDPVVIIAILGFGFISSISFVIMELVFKPLLHPRLISFPLLWYFAILIVIGLVNYLYKIVLGSPHSTLELLETLYRTVVLALPLLGLLSVWNYRKKTAGAGRVKFFSENVRSYILVDPKDILYIMCEDNYSSFFIRQSNHVKKNILRGSLKHFEKQVHGTSLQRCNRSYIINLSHVQEFNFLSQAGNVSISGLDHPISVSRKYLDNVKKAMQFYPS